ncbi:MAG: hypothetical protein D3905_06835 [Candidatus Electrothrix sp. AS4_5]|nr:hypothetical protein [Candidatus Electrothrix gigas]MCI5189503.1 hypothetical protein [Candidatus Electrothrix gigas]
MKSKKKSVLSFLISIMPTSRLRVFLYGKLFGYRIHKSTLGWGTIILIRKADLNGCWIGRNNKFVGPMSLTIKQGVTIGRGNTFKCGWWTVDEKFNLAQYDRRLLIGTGALITSNHYFDVAGSFVLGDGSWIAGYGSQFWTHGAGASERNIFIGQNCYIGSAVRFAPGSAIGNNTLVGLGSILTQKFSDENVLLGGQPAKILKKDYCWRTQKNEK